jgi:methylase of polypeptide subunit release factors
MVDWAAAQKNPKRIVDPGMGSGRFLVQAAAVFPAATLIGVETDPLAALLARANLAAIGVGRRSRIIVGDYRHFNEPVPSASTLYIGNPPYVRHHQIAAKWKDWLFDEAAKLGHKASKLAGLHVHFFPCDSPQCATW